MPLPQLRPEETLTRFELAGSFAFGFDGGAPSAGAALRIEQRLRSDTEILADELTAVVRLDVLHQCIQFLLISQQLARAGVFVDE